MSKIYHKLLIQVSLKKFSFAIKDKLAHEITYFASEALITSKPIEEQLDKFFQKHAELSDKYDEIIVLHDNALNTFIPKDLFNEDAMGNYLQYTTKVFSTDYFAYDELETSKINNVYVPYVSINNYLIDKFGSFNYQNINTLLVEILLKKSVQNLEKEVYAFLQKDHFELIVVQNGELVFFNSFQYQTAQDFIYYILFTYEQIQLDPEVIPLHLMGRADEGDSYYQQAYDYIRKVDIIQNKFFISDDLLLHHQVPKQYYILFHS
ncbi:DUF3822 family protein [Myroides sp. M-43]|uniref:DUF3822 family protein n=1 Tax=Myroides oncorhynchi TaxID=2893756 RepID=UPI001E3CB176|nr:DUF3822 family protein [Myroides oncorhynchi]MCC9044511.1 DUF3822 family protein [Myroides oncorhynchi]